MGRIRLCTLIASGALAALVLASPASAYSPGTSPDFFGVNGAFLRNFVSSDKAASLDGLATSMGQQGIAWTRLTFDQSVEERTKGTFNWHVPDTMIAALARHGVRGLGSFVGTASWAADSSSVANCGSRAAPADLNGWSQWVSAAAKRYGSNGTFWTAHPELPKLPIRTWEIGNEVNSGIYWCPAANPEQYAAVYGASATAIKSADSGSQTIVAGLAPRFGWQTTTDLDVPAFLSRMIVADPSLATSIPEVAIHPYAATADDALGVIAQFRRAMRSAGMPNTPMLADEIGWYTQGAAGPLQVSQEERANQIREVANSFWRLDCGVKGVAPYSWITMQQDASNSEDWYGLADPATGAPNAGGLAYGQQIRLALGQGESAPPQATLRVCGPKDLTVQNHGSGTVASAPAGIECDSTCTATFDDASRVTLTATPAAGYRFGSWSGCASVTGNQCTVSLTDDRTVTVTFVAQRAANIQKTGAGSVTSNLAGINCGTTCSALYDVSTPLVLSATAAPGYAFRGWTGCDTAIGNQCAIALDSDRDVGATFVPRRTLTTQRSGSGIITSSPAGISCGPACTATVDDATQVTLTATPSAGYGFRGWSGCPSTSGDRCTLTMDSDITVGASFAPERSLTAQLSGEGSIISAPAGIDCGSDCAATFDYASQVTLTAAPASGYALRNWSGCTSANGNQCTVSMSADTTVSARFVARRTLTVQRTGPGTIVGNVGGISCGSSCTTVVDDGTQVTLTASPSTGNIFRGWSGCDAVSGNQCTVSMGSDKAVGASFVARRTLTVQRNGSGKIGSSPAGIDCGTSCSSVVDDGTQVTLTASPSAGYALHGWSNCTSVSGDQCTVLMSADTAVSASFVPVRSLTVQKSGSGSIASSSHEIDCGSACNATVDYLAEVTLTATPSPGHAFRRWTGCTSVSGEQCTVLMSADTTVNADFVAQRTLIARKSGPGTLVSSPGGINCGTDCTQGLDDGTTVTLTANPAPGYRLEEWSGCDTTSGNECRITMDDDSTVSADIEPIDPPDTWISKVTVARRTRLVTFTFAGTAGTGALTYSCGIDNRPATRCGTSVSYKLRPGRHRFSVVALDELGRADPTPATRTFRVRRR
jgi:List-Bact-rpt repeat protein